MMTGLVSIVAAWQKMTRVEMMMMMMMIGTLDGQLHEGMIGPIGMRLLGVC